MTKAPLQLIFNSVVRDWGGEPLEAYEAIKARADKTIGAKFKYLRIYKPRNRYGDRAPDNHIIKGPVLSVEDLELKTNFD